MNIVQRLYVAFIPWMSSSQTCDYIYMTEQILKIKYVKEFLKKFRKVIWRYDNDTEFYSKAWIWWISYKFSASFPNFHNIIVSPLFHRHSESDTDRFFGTLKKKLLTAAKNDEINSWMKVYGILKNYADSTDNVIITYGPLPTKPLKENYLNFKSHVLGTMTWWEFKITNGKVVNIKSKVFPWSEKYIEYKMSKLEKERKIRRGKKGNRSEIVDNPTLTTKVPTNHTEFLKNKKEQRLKFDSIAIKPNKTEMLNEVGRTILSTSYDPPPTYSTDNPPSSTKELRIAIQTGVIIDSGKFNTSNLKIYLLYDSSSRKMVEVVFMLGTNGKLRIVPVLKGG